VTQTKGPSHVTPGSGGRLGTVVDDANFVMITGDGDDAVSMAQPCRSSKCHMLRPLELADWQVFGIHDMWPENPHHRLALKPPGGNASLRGHSRSGLRV
jgi:hypothetical protein